MKKIHQLMAGLAIVLPALCVPALAGPTNPNEVLNTVPGGDAAAQRRADIVEKIVAKWSPHVTEAYNTDAASWARSMVTPFAMASLAALERAMHARTFDDMTAALVPTAAGLAVPKLLGDAAADLVYVPVTPCRVADTRVAGGAIAASTVRSFDITAVSDYTFQGGAAGNCNGVGAAGSFAAAAFNFTVVAPAGAGYITAFPFGGVQPLASTLNYGAGEVRGNFAIVPLDQGASANELSVYTFAQTHLVIDIVGYYITPQATGLQCVETANTNVVISANGGTGNSVAPACPVTYVQTATNCETTSWQMPVVYFQSGTCSARNGDTVSQTLRASRTCCRIPGR